MKETPDYEKYPISEEEMGKRYKNWTNSGQMVVLYRVGKEIAARKLLERLKRNITASERTRCGCRSRAPRAKTFTTAWPWRKQIGYFAELGYLVVVPDQRG